MSRYLITTACERSWSFERPVLFLGEWCRQYARRSSWEAMDAEVAKPYGLDVPTRRRDSALAAALFDELLPELSDALNECHGVSHGHRYWNMLIGHWLQRCISTTINRYAAVRQVMRNHTIAGTKVLDQDAYVLATTDVLSFVYACNDPAWNYAFYSRVLKFIGTVPYDSDDGRSLQETMFERKSPSAGGGSRRLVDLMRWTLSKFSSEHDGFILNSCLPLPDELLVQVGLHQVPQLWKSCVIPAIAPSAPRRAALKLSRENHEGLGRLIRQLIPELIPTCYVEGYQALLHEVRRLPWPAKPKFILTAFNFFSDEVFKAWAAQKAEEGVPYFVSQHGNNYGTLSGFERWPELEASDKFFTWGWRKDEKKTVPAYVFRLSRRRLEHAADGGLLLIEIHPPPFLGPWDNYAEHAIYQEDQFRFADALPQGIRNALTVRLHAEYRNYDWADAERWRGRTDVSIDGGGRPIRQLIAKSRLVVHSYDSTGILETLACNIPTIAFWRGGLDHLVAEARDAYSTLVEAGILFEDGAGAGAAVARHWDGIDEWWSSREVQAARSAFCEKYARLSTTPVRTMINLLRH